MNVSISEVFNTSVASYALAMAFRVQLLEGLLDAYEISIDEFCEQKHLYKSTILLLVRILVDINVLRQENGTDGAIISKGYNFSDAYRFQSFFYWLHAGYGALLNDAKNLLREDEGPDFSNKRSIADIAISGKEYGRILVDPYFRDIIKKDKTNYNVSIDLGCGSAERLIWLASQRKHFQGIGIDKDKRTIELARSNVQVLNLDDQITLLEMDILNLTEKTTFLDVDSIFSFFLGHDLWPRNQVVSFFRQLHRTFPRAKRFLFCDTYRFETKNTDKTPIFTLGFELTHSLMRQYIPTYSEWLVVFDSTGWVVKEEIDIDIPSSTIFILDAL